jgi:hypothetical protein
MPPTFLHPVSLLNLLMFHGKPQTEASWNILLPRQLARVMYSCVSARFQKTSSHKHMFPDTEFGVYRMVFYFLEKKPTRKGKFYDNSRQY